MYKVKYETTQSIKEFLFDDKASAEAFFKGVESLKKYLLIVNLELTEVE